MLYKGVLISAASGKIGDAVASHNQHGPYFRSKGVMVDPETSTQDMVRTAMTDQVAAWQAQTPDYRAAWEDYAKRVERPKSRPCSRHNTGFNEYIRWSVPRAYANAAFGTGLGIGDAIAKLPQALTPKNTSIRLYAHLNRLQVFYDPADYWCFDQDAALLIYVSSRKQIDGTIGTTTLKPTINFYVGPWRLWHVIPGDPDDPLSGEYHAGLDFAALDPARVFVKLVVTTDDYGQSRPLPIMADQS